MAIKSANVIARVEPEVKEKAELILEGLGVSTSSLINMLYKQVILTKGIPFPIKYPSIPQSRDEMSEEQFDQMMESGVLEAKEGKGRNVAEVFAELKRE